MTYLLFIKRVLPISPIKFLYLLVSQTFEFGSININILFTDISSLDESISISEETTKRVRKSSDDSERLEMYHLSAPEDSKLSFSCPSLEIPEEIPVYKQAEIHRKRHRFSRKKIFTPAHKMMEKFTRYRKTSAK
ncbi:rab effector Noc2 [Trichonephila clavipes]|nr:rab effector Noc2 [Trichonephila clavipes]